GDLLQRPKWLRCRDPRLSPAKTAPVRATVLALLAVCLSAPESAQARLLFWPQYGSWWGYQSPWRHSERHRRPKPSLGSKDEVKEATNGPLQIVISIADQRISVYDNGALIARSAVSTGTQGHPTPFGIFSVIGKQRWHRSNLYSAAPMPYMQRITWSGVALHAGVVPGHPASHGCIRLKTDFAIRLWHLTKRGTRVIIAPDETQPVEIAHPNLFAAGPKPASDQGEAAAATSKPAIVTAEVHPGSTPAETQPVADIQAPAAMQPAAPPRKVDRVSVFVSRKAGKLFVRQGFTPLFDVPVNIRDPEQPLGTHVFTL